MSRLSNSMTHQRHVTGQMVCLPTRGRHAADRQRRKNVTTRYVAEHFHLINRVFAVFIRTAVLSTLSKTGRTSFNYPTLQPTTRYCVSLRMKMKLSRVSFLFGIQCCLACCIKLTQSTLGFYVYYVCY